MKRIFTAPWVLTLAALLVVLVAQPRPAEASLAEEEFARDFQVRASESRGFAKSRHASFYKKTNARGYGLKVKGTLDGVGRGVENIVDRLERRATMTTAMVGATMDAPGRLARRLPLRPYVTGGAGVTVYDASGVNISTHAARGVRAVPVARMGGGLALRMGEKMNLDIAYKAGLAAGESLHKTAATQIVDVSVKYRF